MNKEPMDTIYIRIEKDMLELKVYCQKKNFKDSVARCFALLKGEGI